MIQKSLTTSEKPVQFGKWQFNSLDGQLKSADKDLRLQPRLARLLSLLVANPNILLTRNDLIDAVWGEKSVNEDALSRCVAELRSALGDNRKAPNYIETVPKKGYRFIYSIEPEKKPKTKYYLKKITPLQIGGLFIFLSLLIIWGVSINSDEPSQSERLKTALISAKRLTTDSRLEHQPELSNKGELLAFSAAEGSRYIVQIINLKGELVFEIKDPQSHLLSATFSPDDTQLLVAAVNKPDCQIYLYQLPSLKRERLTDCHSPGGPGILDWSIDGKSFAFVKQSGQSINNPIQPAAAIWLFDMETGQQTQLTSPSGLDTYDTRPQFSSDGKKLGFTRGSDSIRNLYMIGVDKDNSSAKALTKDKAFITSFNWLNDNKQLVFDSNELGDRNLWLLNTETGKKDLLGARDAKYPSLNLDNRLLAFQEVRYNANIWQVNLTNIDAEPTPIIQSIKYNNFPTYSPNGKSVAFVSNRQGKSAIWLYSIETKKQTRLLAIPKTDLVIPNWSSDGKHILVSSRGPDGYRCYQIDIASKQYKPLYAIQQQHHECQYAPQGDILAVLKEPGENSSLLKLTTSGEIKKLTGFSVERVQPSSLNTIVYSQPKKAGLYSMDYEGNNREIVLEGFDYRLDGHWIVQGEYLYYPKFVGNKGIWRRHLGTDEEELVTKSLPSAIGLTIDVSPDGTQLLFSQTDDRKADIYLTKLNH